MLCYKKISGLIVIIFCILTGRCVKPSCAVNVKCWYPSDNGREDFVCINKGKMRCALLVEVFPFLEKISIENKTVSLSVRLEDAEEENIKIGNYSEDVIDVVIPVKPCSVQDPTRSLNLIASLLSFPLTFLLDSKSKKNSTEEAGEADKVEFLPEESCNEQILEKDLDFVYEFIEKNFDDISADHFLVFFIGCYPIQSLGWVINKKFIEVSLSVLERKTGKESIFNYGLQCFTLLTKAMTAIGYSYFTFCSRGRIMCNNTRTSTHCLDINRIYKQLVNEVNCEKSLIVKCYEVDDDKSKSGEKAEDRIENVPLFKGLLDVVNVENIMRGEAEKVKIKVSEKEFFPILKMLMKESNIAYLDFQHRAKFCKKSSIEGSKHKFYSLLGIDEIKKNFPKLSVECSVAIDYLIINYKNDSSLGDLINMLALGINITKIKIELPEKKVKIELPEKKVKIELSKTNNEKLIDEVNESKNEYVLLKYTVFADDNAEGLKKKSVIDSLVVRNHISSENFVLELLYLLTHFNISRRSIPSTKDKKNYCDLKGLLNSNVKGRDALLDVLSEKFPALFPEKYEEVEERLDRRVAAVKEALTEKRGKKRKASWCSQQYYAGERKRSFSDE